MPKSTFFRNISRKFTNGISFSCRKGTKSDGGVTWDRFVKKLGWCYIGPVERPLDCSVAAYGQLALWTGITGKVPGAALRPGEGQARWRGNGRWVERVADYPVLASELAFELNSPIRDSATTNPSCREGVSPRV